MTKGEEGVEEMEEVVEEKLKKRDQLKARVLELTLEAERVESENQVSSRQCRRKV